MLTRPLALLLLLFAGGGSVAHAQSTWTNCASEGAICSFSGIKLARYGEPWADRWTPPRELLAPVPANNEFWGDPSPGTAKRVQIMDAPVALFLIPWTLTWTHATRLSDGSPLTDRTGYLIETRSSDADPWLAVSTVSADADVARLSLAPGTRQFRLTTLSSWGSSAPSASVIASRAPGTVPLPPTDVGVQGSELMLVSGSATGLRAVFAPTSARSRGTRIGDLAVGPTTQVDPPFNRVRCDRADRIVAGATTYYRVTDQRVPTQYRAGYVTGCVSMGLQ